MLKMMYTLAAALAFVLSTSASARAAEESLSGLTAGEVQKAVENYGKKGWKPVSVKGYADGNQSKYDITFREEKGGWIMHHEMTQDKFNTHKQDLALSGWKVTVHSTWKVNGQVRHVAVWTK